MGSSQSLDLPVSDIFFTNSTTLLFTSRTIQFTHNCQLQVMIDAIAILVRHLTPTIFRAKTTQVGDFVWFLHRTHNFTLIHLGNALWDLCGFCTEDVSTPREAVHVKTSTLQNCDLCGCWNERFNGLVSAYIYVYICSNIMRQIAQTRWSVHKSI